MASVPGGFVPGCLVVVSGLKDKAKGAQGESIDLNGEKAQLIEWRADVELWVATTLSGQMIGIGSKYLRLLKPDELGSFDLVMGPKSEPKQLANSITQILVDKGYVAINVILADSYREEIFDETKGLEANGGLMRLPKGFEHGHFGQGGKGKVIQLDRNMPAGLAGTQLPKQDENLSMMSDLLKPLLKKNLGIDIRERTPTLLRLPFADIEDESKYLPTVATAEEADQFLELMGRRQLGVLQFLGPEAGTLTLVPRRTGLEEVSIPATPNTMVLYLAEQYSQKLTTSGESVSLSCWYVEPQRSYQVLTSAPISSTASGSTSIAIFGAGAPPPRTKQQVVVTGLASRDPCNCNTEEQFWYALRHGGTDGFVAIPHTRFDLDEYIDYGDQQRAMMSGKSYCRHQGQVEGIEYFDDKFFNIPKAEVWGMDPEQRVICEVGWNALQSAGYNDGKLRRDSAHLGVYVGISASDWSNLSTSLQIGGSPNGVPETFIANRFSFIFNLKGPSYIANTACSASLVAAHAAKLNLLSTYDPLEGAVCAGVSLNTGPGTWVGNCAGGMLSFRGRSFSFMDSADGYGRGEGAACSVIQRGKQDDEGAFALMAGSHSNSDGRSASLTAPNGPAQQRLLRAVLEETGTTVTEVSTYEAHGTGTLLGDPIEIGAVVKVLGKGRQNALCVSCSKTNIGHLEGGAGMSGFVKCVLSVMHSEGVANIHSNLINPNLSLDNFSGNFLSEGLAYGFENTYVGVSGFGYGGTNAHCMAYGRRNFVKADTAVDDAVAGASGSELTFRRITNAPAPEIEMDSENPEEWTTTGIPHLTAKDGDKFHVQLNKGGQAVWRALVEPDLPDEMPTPFIQGSFNDGGADMLDTSEVEGLYTYEITLGPSGVETFSIILDADPDLCYFPLEASCSKKAKHISGPSVPPSPEHAWVIKGAPDDTYRVEFFLSGSSRTVSWIQVVDPDKLSFQDSVSQRLLALGPGAPGATAAGAGETYE